MDQILRQIAKYFGKIDSVIHMFGAFSILILVVLNVINIMLRYLVNKPIIWCLEVSILLFFLSVFLCWGYTTQGDRHVSIEFLVTKLPNRIQIVLKRLLLGLSIAIFIVIISAGVLFGVYAFRDHEVTDILAIPIYPFKFLMALGALFVFLELVIKSAKR
jgi:TRAP-type C4-dicarboxylate transport system permease small subunit